MYEQYSLFNVSFENLYLILRRKDICLEADFIIESMWLLHLLFEDRLHLSACVVFIMSKTVLSILSSVISSICVFEMSITSVFLGIKSY